MKRVNIGDQIIYIPWSRPSRVSTVEEIEICKHGEKNGFKVKSCDLDQHQNGTITLSDGHWCYFDQVKQLIKQ